MSHKTDHTSSHCYQNHTQIHHLHHRHNQNIDKYRQRTHLLPLSNTEATTKIISKQYCINYINNNNKSNNTKMNFSRYKMNSSRFIINTILTIFLFNFVIIDPESILSESARTRLKNTLDVKFNLDCHEPQCTSTDTNQSAVNLFQVISSNPETPQKSNFIWSNIGGPPMVITTSSNQDSDLRIDWQSILGHTSSGDESSTVVGSTDNQKTTQNASPKPPAPTTDGFHFNITPDAAIGLLVEKVMLFNDTNESGLFTKDEPHIEIDWGQVIWDQAVRTTYNKDDFLKTHLRMRPPHKILGGDLKIKLAIPRNYRADRQQEVPHLKLNNRSLLVVIVADGLQPPADFTNPRLAMTFVIVVQTPSNQVSLDTDSESLISDEYTPGVFRIKSLQFKSKQDAEAAARRSDEEASGNAYVDVEGQTPEARIALSQSAGKAGEASSLIGGTSSDKGNLGFLYWKEVAYTDRRKMISRTVDVYDNEIPMSMDTLPKISQPFYQYFKYQPSVGPKPQYKLYRIEVIFGKGESTYGATNFTDFSFVFGLGAAPREQAFSFLVKFIIFVCFCLPLLVMLAGLGFLMLRRFRRGGDTELLLTAES